MPAQAAKEMKPTSHMDELAKLRALATDNAIKYAKVRHILNIVGIIVGEGDHEKIPEKVKAIANRYYTDKTENPLERSKRGQL